MISILVYDEKTRRLIGLKNYQKARDLLKEALSLYPQHADFYYLLSFVEHHLGKAPSAFSLISTAIRLYPNNVDYLYQKALIEIDLDIKEAKKSILKGLKLNPEYYLLHSLLGYIYLMENDLDFALIKINKALTLNPKDVSSLGIKYQIQQFQGKKLAAQKTIDQALQLDPNNAYLLKILGSFRFNEFQDSKTIEILANALRQNPNDREAQLYYSKAKYHNSLLYDWLHKAQESGNKIIESYYGLVNLIIIICFTTFYVVAHQTDKQLLYFVLFNILFLIMMLPKHAPALKLGLEIILKTPEIKQIKQERVYGIIYLSLVCLSILLIILSFIFQSIAFATIGFYIFTFILLIQGYIDYRNTSILIWSVLIILPTIFMIVYFITILNGKGGLDLLYFLTLIFTMTYYSIRNIARN